MVDLLDITARRDILGKLSIRKVLMKIGDNISIRANLKATRRTKNRIHEKGPSFSVRSPPKKVVFDGGAGLWVLLESEEVEWMGWLPVAEIEVISS